MAVAFTGNLVVEAVASRQIIPDRIRASMFDPQGDARRLSPSPSRFQPSTTQRAYRRRLSDSVSRCAPLFREQECQGQGNAAPSRWTDETIHGPDELPPS